jgi:hypothetical protein
VRHSTRTTHVEVADPQSLDDQAEAAGGGYPRWYAPECANGAMRGSRSRLSRTCTSPQSSPSVQAVLFRAGRTVILGRGSWHSSRSDARAKGAPALHAPRRHGAELTKDPDRVRYRPPASDPGHVRRSSSLCRRARRRSPPRVLSGLPHGTMASRISDHAARGTRCPVWLTIVSWDLGRWLAHHRACSVPTVVSSPP